MSEYFKHAYCRSRIFSRRIVNVSLIVCIVLLIGWIYEIRTTDTYTKNKKENHHV